MKSRGTTEEGSLVRGRGRPVSVKKTVECNENKFYG